MNRKRRPLKSEPETSISLFQQPLQLLEHITLDTGLPKGRLSVYEFRHFVQALLVRKLLWGRVSAEQITTVMSGRSTEEAKRMFLEGTGIVLRGSEDRNAQESAASGMIEAWRRVQLMPGLEVHLRNDLLKLGTAELKELLASFEELLRRGI